MATLDRPGWPEHNPFDDRAHWFSHKDDMGSDRCGGCGVRMRKSGYRVHSFKVKRKGK